jgi:hypothetical protein
MPLKQWLRGAMVATIIILPYLSGCNSESMKSGPGGGSGSGTAGGRPLVGAGDHGEPDGSRGRAGC